MTLILPQDSQIIPLPFLAVCEGMADAEFVQALLVHNGIKNCNVGCPSVTVCKRQVGNNDLERYFSALSFLRKKQVDALRGVIVILDADTDANRQFERACNALAQAEFPVPREPFTIDQRENGFRVGVYIIPGRDRTGTLERLLLEAVVKHTPKYKGCLDEYLNCIAAVTEVTDNQDAKMRMSALVAATCKSNPWASAGMMWHDKGNPVPIESVCFDSVSEFLKAFVS